GQSAEDKLKLHWPKEYIKPAKDSYRITKDKIDKALKNAKNLRKYNSQISSNNPYTEIDLLIDVLLELKMQI
ncbi:MAG: RloB-like protein, partial [Gammaproteobacteria bacterium]|nr:RloB-like protein [Gammaproteobacteria bacterium]